ncbi:MFS general substrate transporter [Exidia glandulosa HHB12029]|uniref:MFS general substrate transporter n=1 Tax=Exidia glandulosa HHB12029 TaxID=1314781 RepID=A0A165N524_EXIGL|nr:MFS general substrate transporter [Exidia glandulosa HHB12029]
MSSDHAYKGDDAYSDESKKASSDTQVEPAVLPAASFAVEDPPQQYRLYKRRWAGLLALFFLNIISGASWPWFGPISIPMADRFDFTSTQVNWLGNAVSLVFLPVSICVPFLCRRFGVRNTCLSGAVCLLIASWLRYAGTADSLSPTGKYALMLISQMIVGIPQPIYQVIGPSFSEIWFDLNFRTTATMIIAIANPLGSALGQLLSPMMSDPKDSILLLGVIGTVIAPLALLIGVDPPIPPTHAAATPSPPMLAMFRAMVGKEREGEPSMDMRERIDFGLLTIIFGLSVEAVSSFSILSNEILEPYGYSSDTAGFVGAALLFSGIVAAICAAPILDRVLTNHLGFAIRVLMPVLAAGWIGFIFAVRRDGTGGLFADVIIIGVTSMILLPVGLEIGCEVTRNPESSSAVLWFVANTLNIIFIPILHAMRSPDDGNPPRNFRRGLILNGALMAFAALLVFGVRGHQKRRELDMQMAQEMKERNGTATRA